MTIVNQFITIMLTVLIGVSEFATISFANEPTPETAKSALSKRTYPWYDAKSDSFRPLQPPKEEVDRGSKMLDSSAPIGQSIGQSVGPILLVMMWTLLVVLIVALLALIARSLGVIDPLVRQARQPDDPGVDIETIEALPEPVRGVRDLLGEAERLAAQASFSDAMTFYYGWQLVQLDRQQWIEVQKGKTNRQYRREISVTRPELNEVFGASIRLFEDAFFGKLSVSQDAFERVWAERDRFRANSRKDR